MPTINQLPLLANVQAGDQIPVYSPNNGDARRLPISQLLTYFQQTFASPTLAVNLFVPGSGFNITVPTPVSNDQWMLLQPAGTLATGTITLPLNTGVPDGTTLLITTTQEITSLTIALNGASAIYGGVSFLGAGTATAIRFYQPTNSWYQINDNAVYAAGVQSFLANPTSANLRAAVTDETGTGALVFATSPNLVTPAINGGSINSAIIGATTPAASTFTTINKVTITAPANAATLTIANNKTLTANNSIAIAGTDSTTMTFPTTSATIARTDAAQSFTGNQTFNNAIVGSIQDLIGPGAINLTTGTTAFASTAAGNALTLFDGVLGQFKTIIYVDELAGGDTGVLTPTNFGNGTTITFNTVGNSVVLQFINFNWWVVSINGAAVA